MVEVVVVEVVVEIVEGNKDMGAWAVGVARATRVVSAGSSGAD